MAVLTRDSFVSDPWNVMDAIFGRTLGSVSPTNGFVPLLDVRETADEYVVMLDLPGVKSEDVQVEVVDRTLTISGPRLPVEAGEAQRVERPYGAFSRMLTLPQGSEPDSIRADCAEGVLTLRVPKSAQAKPKKIQITGGTARKAIETK
jgi:HSP20 family protein